VAEPGDCPLGVECYIYDRERALEAVVLQDGSVIDYQYNVFRGLLVLLRHGPLVDDLADA
jgi:hypothetical protein